MFAAAPRFASPSVRSKSRNQLGERSQQTAFRPANSTTLRRMQTSGPSLQAGELSGFAPGRARRAEAAFVGEALANHFAYLQLKRSAIARQIGDAGDAGVESADSVVRQVDAGAIGGAPDAPAPAAPVPAPPAPAPPAPAAVPAHPTAISSTSVRSQLNFGAVYRHVFTSSTGSVADINGVLVGEEVTVARDDFATGFTGVPLGTITAHLNAAGEMADSIGTPAAVIRNALPSIGTFPAVLDTPQTLHWKNGATWNLIVAVAIDFRVHKRGDGTMEAETRDNGVSVFQAV